MTAEDSDAVTSHPDAGLSSTKGTGESTGEQAKKKPKSAATPIPPAAKAKLAARERGKTHSSSRTPVQIGSPRWVVPLMVVMFLVGLAWIVAYYVAPDAPLLSTLGWWNVVVGFGFLAGGFLVATRWR